MSTTPFRAGGALTDEHAAIYVDRQADRRVVTHLRAMDYLLLIEPRQQGKSSLVNRLLYHQVPGDVALAYVDVTTPDPSTEVSWYETLCPRILRQLRRVVPRDRQPNLPHNSVGWREFLCDVALCAQEAGQRAVIALDEIGAVTFPGATAFFSVLRDAYNSRQAEPELRHLTFLLAGAFHPRDLIRDDRISPFNVAQRVRLDDFTPDEVRTLVAAGGWPPEQVGELAGRVHHWTGGQPYLSQLLCSYLGPQATPADVDAGVERLRRDDENHLPPMLARLGEDGPLCRYAGRILDGERLRFYPRENRRQAQLELLGAIKAGEDGCCAIRNRIYEQALPDALARPVGEHGTRMAPDQEHPEPEPVPVAAAAHPGTRPPDGEGQGRRLRWLHLSDFHVGKDNYGQRRLFSYILEQVDRRVQAGNGPDMVFITGDVANRGQPAEYREFVDSFYRPLAGQVGAGCRERIWIVPGNHDVDRSQARPVETHGILDRLDIFLDPDEAGLAERRSIFARFQAFAAGDPTWPDEPHWLFSSRGAMIRTLNLGGSSVGILGLNTAWLSCSDEDRHHLSAGKGMIEEGLKQLEDCDLRIVLGHHPLGWFRDQEINAVRARFGQHNVLYLHGHMHRTHSRYEEGGGYPFLALQAGACFQAREDELWVNRILWCSLDLERRELSVEPLNWSRDHQDWVVDGGAFPPRYQWPGTDRWVLDLPGS